MSSGLKRLIDAEPKVTRYDTIVGDGDCGIGLKRGAEAVLKVIEGSDINEDIIITVHKIVNAVEATMDGIDGTKGVGMVR